MKYKRINGVQRFQRYDLMCNKINPNNGYGYILEPQTVSNSDSWLNEFWEFWVGSCRHEVQNEAAETRRKHNNDL
jgi:hypothetical protein